MTVAEGIYRVSHTEGRRHYVQDAEQIETIVSTLREGHYCTVLGPRYCHKTQLLKDVGKVLADNNCGVCVWLDFRDLQFSDPCARDFPRVLAGAVGEKLRGLLGCEPAIPESAVGDTRSLQRYLQDCPVAAKRDVYLLLNRLENVPLAPLESLLLVLRAIFEARGATDSNRLTVATASTLSVAELALGAGSPFNIAHLFWSQDMDEAASRLLLDHISEEEGVPFSGEGLDRLLAAARGDRYLVPNLCLQCVGLARKAGQPIGAGHVDASIEWFLESQTQHYLPLQETIRALESDPLALLNALDVLKEGRVPRNRLRIEIETPFDPLRLSGAVHVDRRGDQVLYSIRNEIYQAYLEKQLFPSRVVDTLRTSGRREEAIAYLEGLPSASAEIRELLLGAMIDAVYAAGDELSAYQLLLQYVTRAFPVSNIRIYCVDGENRRLHSVAHRGLEAASADDLSLDKDCTECNAVRNRHPVMGECSIALPLSGRNDGPFAVAVLPDSAILPHHQQFHELVHFLHRAGWAIADVSARQHGLQAFERVFQRWNRAASSLDPEEVLTATIDAAMIAVPAAQTGAVFLWDQRRQKLTVRAQRGYQPHIVELAQLAKGQGYVGWVYQNRKPVLLENVGADARNVFIGNFDERSAICVPLEAWGRSIGALCLQNASQYGAFQPRDVQVLYSFAGQAALAIQNSRFTAELLDLGLKINRPELKEEEIFRAAVQSIMNVVDAAAANMLLLRDTNDPLLCLSESPRLSVSEGLSPEFDRLVRPRNDGLTAMVLKTGAPQFVTHPDDPPGLNQLASESGARALICLPLKAIEGLIGVLCVHYNEPHEFSAHEVRKLLLFANQTALAVQNARLHTQLTSTASIVWMGIGFSGLAHQIAQKVGAIRLAVSGLRRHLAGQPHADALAKIDTYAEAIGKIPLRSLLPSDESTEVVDLHAFLREQVPHWCNASYAPVPDVSSLATGPLMVAADRRRLALLIEILITNAVRAMRQAVVRELTIKSQARGEAAEVRVTNTGKPIAPNVRSMLFKKPVQSAEGTGVGLLIAQSIVNSYKGEIWLEKSDPGGTTFAFRLPLRRPQH
jgi:GAF domain-containing protein